MTEPNPLSKKLLERVSKLPPELLEQVLIELYPPGFFASDDWTDEFERKYREECEAAEGPEGEDKDIAADLQAEREGEKEDSTFATEKRDREPGTKESDQDSKTAFYDLEDAPTPYPDYKRSPPGRDHMSIPLARAWQSVKEADQALIDLLETKPDLKPQIDRILFLHAQREGRSAAKEWERDITDGGWEKVVGAHGAHLDDAEGKYEDTKEEWDSAWRWLSEQASRELVTWERMQEFGDEAVGVLEDEERVLPYLR